MMQARAAIRREKRATRDSLPGDRRREAAAAVLRRLRKLHDYMNAHRVALYFPVSGELDTSAICADLWSRRKFCYLPVIVDNPAVPLGFANYTSSKTMRPNQFGIPEPRCRPAALLSAQYLDILLLPLTAFDRGGNRLGMGGGYYDRTLSFRGGTVSRRRPRLYGLAYSEQEAPELPVEPWDVRLDGIVTQQEIILTPGTSS